MRLLVIVTLLNSHRRKPAPFFISTFTQWKCSTLPLWLDFPIILIPPIVRPLLSRINLGMVKVAIALEEHCICLTFPPLPWCLFLCHRTVHHVSILAEEVQCAPSCLQVSGEALRSLEFSPTPPTHESLALIYSAGYNDRSFWNILQMGPIKPPDFISRHGLLWALIIKVCNLSETNKINNCQKLWVIKDTSKVLLVYPLKGDFRPLLHPFPFG